MAGLQQLPGHRAWTATSVARAVTGEPDIVVVGDYGLPAMIAWNLAGERTADDARHAGAAGRRGAPPGPGGAAGAAVRRDAAAPRPAPAGCGRRQSLTATEFGVTFIFGSYSTTSARWPSLPSVARSSSRQARTGPVEAGHGGRAAAGAHDVEIRFDGCSAHHAPTWHTPRPKPWTAPSPAPSWAGHPKVARLSRRW